MKHVLLILFLLPAFLPAAGSQELPQVLKERDEVYFTFTVRDPAELHRLTRILSIDNVRGNQVWAYANTREYLAFLKEGYDITLLPSPGLGPGAETRDYGILSPSTVWNYYPTYSSYESLMAQFQTMYPSLCNLDTLTTLPTGRRLLMLKISDNVNTDETEPEFLYTSTMHGDETTGYILMMHLADYLLSNYGTNPEATELVNNLEIYICPLANPDGTYFGGNNTVTGARRANFNGVDLNRNYPDFIFGPHPDLNPWQPETVAFMDFATQRHFVMGANFHGGIEVVNYPWDTWATLHADDNWFYFTSREYADTVHLHAPLTYMDDLDNGITNGYEWYEADGTRQDYMNYYHHCFETTIELSTTKLLPAAQLLTLWDYNWRSLIHYLKEARYGIHGVVTDQVTGQPIVAKITIPGHDINNSEVYSVAGNGDYHRLLKAGTYNLEVSAPCYQTQFFPGVVVTDHASITLDVQMVPGPPVTTTAVSGMVGSTALSGGELSCTTNFTITAKGVCWSTSANPTLANSHTVDGSGGGTFTSTLTGLLPSTIYHVRAYATTPSGTSYGNDLTFMSACGTVSAFPWNEGFENGGVIPACWTQEQVNNSGINWVFITGNGGSYPSTAHTGTYNACLKDNNSADNKTRLMAPVLDLSGLPSPQLKFWHTQVYWSGDQDYLTVYYKTSAGGTWTQLAYYNTNVATWTQRTLALPNPGSTYYIAFEGNAKYGYGVCIDDVSVSSSCSVIYPVSVSIAGTAETVMEGTTVTFTATPVNGGTVPAYQWKVNGTNVTGGTASTYAYIPEDGDQVVCVLTSNGTCITGNPATSNVITMTVTPLVPSTLGLQGVTVTGTDCFNALQTVVTAGGGTFFTVQPTGSVTIIAGENILLYPGTSILEGGYFLGYIAPGGPWCAAPGDAQAAGSTMLPQRERAGLRVYPNPAESEFTVEIPWGLFKNDPLLEMFDLRGSVVFSRKVERTTSGSVFTVSSLPKGLYLLRAADGTSSATSRVIIH